jgi:hypothetical protein
VLRKQVRRFTHETKVKNLDDIAATLTIFENLVNDFREAGGEEVQDATMKSDALEVLPESLREQLLWHTTKKDVSWAMWRDHVVDTAAEIQRHRGRAGINVVEPAPRLEAQQGEAPNKDDIMAAISEKITEILAVGGFGGRPGGYGGRPPRPPMGGQSRPPAGNEATMRCANCGKLGHTAIKCNQPQVPRDRRACFNCGKPGHVKANCPEPARGGTSGAIRAVDDVEVGDAFCMVNDANDPGFTLVTKNFMSKSFMGKKPRPQPRAITLADFIPTVNSFSALKNEDNDKYEPQIPKIPMKRGCNCGKYDCCTDSDFVRTESDFVGWPILV